jgi:hypothetical protein
MIKIFFLQSFRCCLMGCFRLFLMGRAAYDFAWRGSKTLSLRNAELLKNLINLGVRFLIHPIIVK